MPGMWYPPAADLGCGLIAEQPVVLPSAPHCSPLPNPPQSEYGDPKHRHTYCNSREGQNGPHDIPFNPLNACRVEEKALAARKSEFPRSRRRGVEQFVVRTEIVGHLAAAQAQEHHTIARFVSCVDHHAPERVRVCVAPVGRCEEARIANRGRQQTIYHSSKGVGSS